MRYKATITFTLEIDATNLQTAEYLAEQSVPNIKNSTSSVKGSGHGSLIEVTSITIEKTTKRQLGKSTTTPLRGVEFPV
jgi:hypothetical protein